MYMLSEDPLFVTQPVISGGKRQTIVLTRDSFLAFRLKRPQLTLLCSICKAPEQLEYH